MRKNETNYLNLSESFLRTLSFKNESTRLFFNFTINRLGCKKSERLSDNFVR